LQAPEGNRLFSSSEDNDTFYLRLPNPPSGGNYTCRLPPFEPATSCLPQNSPLRDPEGASIAVDEVKASFSILAAEMAEQKTSFESRLNVLENQNADLVNELNQTKNDLAALETKFSKICSCSLWCFGFCHLLFFLKDDFFIPNAIDFFSHNRLIQNLYKH
jgi:hypothetical protein